MKTLSNKRILLGVTGGIAAYKSADLVRRLLERGADVRVVMSQGAMEFITPLTMQALSGKPVHTELLDHSAEAAMGHIELARWADIIVVAPASANFIAKLTHGIADDLLTTLCLASAAPIHIAPAMNQQMWRNVATQSNINTVVNRDINLIGPAEGDQACGDVGPGRMVEPMDIARHIEQSFRGSILSGLQVMVTAGPTQEAIDPVRYISNRSSGKMGYAIAEAALEAGAEVTLVSGPVNLDVPDINEFLPVCSALEMQKVVMDAVSNKDIFISAAAVADYRCLDVKPLKMKKTQDRINLALEKNPDILKEVSSLEKPPFTVGFAAETDALIENAKEKMKVKQLDMIAANYVGEGLGFETEENCLELIWEDGYKKLEKAHKNKLARELINTVADRFHAKSKNKTH
jgi:phosphopantothenoylcysteine decarboxylase/phosphopantothenate--cysteine ligase